MRWPLLLAMTGLACRNMQEPEAEARPLFHVGADRAQLGYDAPFSIAVRFPATVNAPIDIRWKQVEGVPVRDIEVGERGMRFSARTPRLSDCRQGVLPWGVVALSPRTRGEVVLEAEWQMTPDRAPQRERVTVSAAARSRGLPNVPTDQRIYLGGSGWHVKEAPRDAHASVEESDGVAMLRPDVGGVWQLTDGEGRLLRILAGRYADTPLDCSRASCHGEIARAALSSPMTWALSRWLRDQAFREDAGPFAARPSDGRACAPACHTTGEPWTHDGGFFDVASDFGLSPSLAGVRDAAQLPRAMRRLGSVGCLACHGPSALPEADARWSILRSDVCAHCHDAPPRYGHVTAWQTTSMARADQDAQASSDSACAPCHTTWGFLRETRQNEQRRAGHSSTQVEAMVDRTPPPGVGHIGIACPACHAVHDVSGQEARPKLLRRPPLGAMFDDIAEEDRARSGTCLACHAPRGPSRLPQASAAAIWVGRAGFDPETGAPIAGPAPHRSVAGGCVGCHREGPDGVERGKSHGFRADRRQCTSCHADAASAAWADERAQIESDIRKLWNDLVELRVIERTKGASDEPMAQPPHAATAAKGGVDSALGRAAYDLSLLLEDRGFFAHNPPYARLLLEKAKKPIERARDAVHRRSGSSPISRARWGGQEPAP